MSNDHPAPEPLTARDLLSVLEWTVDKARANLTRVQSMRADEECGPGTVEEAENWLRLCRRALADQEVHPAPAGSGPDRADLVTLIHDTALSNGWLSRLDAERIAGRVLEALAHPAPAKT